MTVQNKEKNQSVELEENNEKMEIDLIKMLSKIIAVRKTLYKVAGIGIVIGIIVALSIPKEYTVNVTLSPEVGGSKDGNGLAGLAASFLNSGVTIGDGSDALNASLSADIISSTPFLIELLSMNVPYPDKNDTMVLNEYLSKQSSPWWNYVIGFPGIIISGVKSLLSDDEINKDGMGQGIIELTKEKKKKIDYLKKKVTASVDKKTFITNVSVTLQDPRVAAIIADSVVYKLQDYITNYRTSKAKDDCVYLEKLFKERQQEYYDAQKKYADYVDTHDNLILQSVRAEQERLQNDMNLTYQVYSQVASQLQIARAKVQEEKPVFAIVEPAVIPLKASSVGLKVYVILFVFLAITITIGWIFIGKEFWKNLKKSL